MPASRWIASSARPKSFSLRTAIPPVSIARLFVPSVCMSIGLTSPGMSTNRASMMSEEAPARIDRVEMDAGTVRLSDGLLQLCLELLHDESLRQKHNRLRARYLRQADSEALDCPQCRQRRGTHGGHQPPGLTADNLVHRQTTAHVRVVDARALNRSAKRLLVVVLSYADGLVLVAEARPFTHLELTTSQFARHLQRRDLLPQFFDAGRQAAVHHPAVDDDADEFSAVEAVTDEGINGVARVFQPRGREVVGVEDEDPSLSRTGC